MSEDEKRDIAAGASGRMLTDADKSEAEKASEEQTTKKAAKKAAKKKATRKRTKKKDEQMEIIERRLEEVEQKLAAHQIETHICYMCHKGGATIQRGNTGEFFHGPCLVNFKNGKDPLPTE